MPCNTQINDECFRYVAPMSRDIHRDSQWPNSRLQRTWPTALPRRICVTISRRGPSRCSAGLGVTHMPQPLSRVSPNALIVIGNAGDRALERHPALAAVALEAIASWSNVEAFLLRLFIQLLGGNESLAASVYLSLEGQSAKASAIKAAAANALATRVQELHVLEAVLSIAKTNEKERNKLAHWVWGDSPNLPDALLLLDPRVSVESLDRSQIYVYREQDLRSIIQANDRLCGFCLRLKSVLSGHVANRNHGLITELVREPEIAERLARQAARAAQQ
jgi:hypothetical protein